MCAIFGTMIKCHNLQYMTGLPAVDSHCLSQGAFVLWWKVFLKIIANNKHWYWFSGRWNHLEGLSLDHGLRNRTVLEFGNARVVSNWITFPRTTQHFQWTNCEVLIRAWGVHPEPTESFTLAIGRWILYCLFRFN